MTLPETKTDPRVSWKEGLIAFLVLWLFWVLARYPAFQAPFWVADDFNMWDFTTWRLTRGGASQGRLLNGIWYSLYFLFPPPDNLGGSNVLRGIQGLLHAGVSLTLLLVLVPSIGRVGAWLSVFLFHLWAFNAEATIWIAGSTYPLAACLSAGGVWLCVRKSRVGWRLLGAFLVAASVHSNQAPALFGFCLWLLWTSLRWFEKGNGKDFIRRTLGEFLWIGGGYFVGGGVSLFFLKTMAASRLSGEYDLAGKFHQLTGFLERLWWFPESYPGALQGAHAVFIGLVLATLVIGVWRGWVKWRMSLILVGLLIALSFLPLVANLLSPENRIPVRALYIAPLVWVAMASILFRLGRDHILLGWITGGLVVSIVLWNLRLGLREAEDFSTVFRRDFETLRELEAFAADHGTREILFMDWKYSAPWNRDPYDLHFFYSDSIKYPIFHDGAANYRFVKFFSGSLEMTPWWPYDPPEPHRWERLRQKYAALGRNLPRDRWIYFKYLPDENIVLVVPR